MFALLAGAALVAQQGGAQAPAPAQPAPPTARRQPAPVGPDGVQRPTFRAQIDYVEVSAIVTDDDGNLVKDLNKSDFEILENGKPQTVAVFTPVKIPFERPERTLIEGRPLKFDVANNEGARDGRVYVIVLDDYHIGVAAHGAGQDRRQGVHREARRRQRPGRGHPRQRPQQRVAGVHHQQGPDARGGRQADGHEAAIRDARAAATTTAPASST